MLPLKKAKKCAKQLKSTQRGTTNAGDKQLNVCTYLVNTTSVLQLNVITRFRWEGICENHFVYLYTSTETYHGQYNNETQ